MVTAVAGFRVGPEIGRGAMGVVHLAEDEHGRRVALKLLAPSLAADERFRRRFLRESAIAATLDDPHVVETVASGEADGILYLALAYIDGEDLREILRREGRLEPPRALALTAQAADALDAAHAFGLVHRDVKPGNILVAGDAAYVCDFGLARHVASVGSLTGDRGFVGTIDYVAPEQIAGREVDGRADQYALACVLFECLTGARPFEHDTDLATVFAHLNETPPRITDHLADVPSTVDDVFARALAKSPHDRFTTCADFVGAVRAALAGELRERRRRATVLTVALGLALVALLASLGTVAIVRGTGPAPARAAPNVTQSSLAGVRLGMTMPQVKKVLGAAWREDVFTTPGFRVLIFFQRRISVYFDGTTPRAIIVTTWSARDRTAAGVGPCSPIADFENAYGDAFAPSRWNVQKGKIYGYTLGKNLFVTPVSNLTRVTDTVGVVALYDGDGPRNDGKGVDVAGGTRPFVGYVTNSESTCSP